MKPSWKPVRRKLAQVDPLYEHELLFFVLNAGKEYRLYPLENKSTGKWRASFTRLTLRKVEEETGFPVWGVIHTHPRDADAYPSEEDLLVSFSLPDLRHGVYHSLRRTLIWYRYDNLLARSECSIEHIPYRFKRMKTWLRYPRNGRTILQGRRLTG